MVRHAWWQEEWMWACAVYKREIKEVFWLRKSIKELMCTPSLFTPYLCTHQGIVSSQGKLPAVTQMVCFIAACKMISWQCYFAWVITAKNLDVYNWSWNCFLISLVSEFFFCFVFLSLKIWNQNFHLFGECLFKGLEPKYLVFKIAC